MTVTVETTIADRAAVACAQWSDIFQHPLLEEDPGRSASAEERRTRSALVRRATDICASCPLLDSCLYSAVVRHDVAGFVAGTTEAQRRRMRTLLDVQVRADDLDSLTGAASPGSQVNHTEIVRLRTQNPHMSLDTIAQRLGCSLSTVKRHLRRARAEADQPSPAAEKQLPSNHDVVRARDEVLATGPRAKRRGRKEHQLAPAA